VLWEGRGGLNPSLQATPRLFHISLRSSSVLSRFLWSLWKSTVAAMRVPWRETPTATVESIDATVNTMARLLSSTYETRRGTMSMHVHANAKTGTCQYHLRSSMVALF
jgi:hypothetical protein